MRLVHYALGPWMACLGLALHSPAASAQVSVLPAPPTRPTPAQLHGILDSILAGARVPALGAAIITRDTVLMLDAVGLRRAGGTTPATPQDLFHLGSDTKSITAGWIALQVDAGRIAWTTTIAEVFPALAKDARREYQDVTLRDLLSHQSGLPADAPSVTCSPLTPVLRGCGFDQEAPRAERLRVAAWGIRQRPVAKHGTFKYSNIDYVIAAAMVEKRLDEDFESSITKRLLAPLGIGTTGFGAAGTAGAEDQPWGHLPQRDNTLRPIPPGPYADLPAIYDVSGTMHMSLYDWGRWIRTVLRAEAGFPSPWKPETARALTTPVVRIDTTNGYALGWGVANLTRNGRTERVLGHQGSNGRNNASAIVFPDAGFAVIVVANAGGPLAADVVGKTQMRLVDLFQLGK